MVRYLAGIKIKVQWNTMRAQTAVFVLSLIGYVYGYVMIGGIAALLVYGMATGVPAAATIAGGLGALYTLGWIVFPLLLASEDASLDPAKLSPFVSPDRQLAWSLVLLTPVGVGFGYLVMITVGMGLGWSFAAGLPTGLAALIGAILGSLTGFVWGRAAVGWAGRFQQGRRSKERAGLLAFSVMMLVFLPLGLWMGVVAENFSWELVQRMLTWVAWSPLGAAWALPSAVAEGRWLSALALAGIAVVSFVSGWAAWRAILPTVMTGIAHPVSRTAWESIERGDNAIATKKSGRHIRTRKQSDMPLALAATRWMKIGVPGPVAAIAAKATTYWLRDPRLTTQLLATVVLALMAIFLPFTLTLEEGDPGGLSTLPGMALAILSAMTVGQVVGGLLPFDSTALWVEVSAGIPGWYDRAGRLLGSLGVIVPFTVFLPIVFSVVHGFSGLACLMFTAATTLGFSAAFTATSIISAQWVYQVQPPGTSPFSTKSTGEFWPTMLLGTAQMAGAAILSAPPGATLAWVAFTHMEGPAWPVASSLLTLVWAAGLMVLGTYLAGRMLNRNLVRLLTQISGWPGHKT